MIDPPLLRGRDVYERVMDGWIDNTHDDAFTHTVRLSDPDFGIELSVVATPPPDYEIRAASCRALAGPVLNDVLDGVPRLAGTRMVAGLTRRAGEVTGSGDGATLVRAAVIEVARLARQVAKLDPERAARAALADPWECWQLDTTGWIDLPDSCFTYSDAGRRLFGTRPVSSPMRPDLYAPRPGQQRVFAREKVSRLERRDGRLHLFHSMHDDVHGFDVTYEIDCESGRIVDARSLTPRLPYAGICSEPQQRIRSLIGEPVDGGLVKRLGPMLGGSAGCAQLYDLSADVFRLLALECG